MNLIVQIIIETGTGQRTQKVARLERQSTCLENAGLTLAARCPARRCSKVTSKYATTQTNTCTRSFWSVQ